MVPASARPATFSLAWVLALAVPSAQLGTRRLTPRAALPSAAEMAARISTTPVMATPSTAVRTLETSVLPGNWMDGFALDLPPAVGACWTTVGRLLDDQDAVAVGLSLGLAAATGAAVALPVMRKLDDGTSMTFAQLVSQRYSGPDVSKFYRRRPLECAQRTLLIGLPLGLWWLGAQVGEFVERVLPFPEEAKAARRTSRGAALRQAIVSTDSVTFIKSGQALALRPDIVKVPEYVRELAKLHDAVGTFPDVVAFDILERELGSPADDLFDFPYGRKPVASASIGQVYKAKVKGTDRVVAVKVQRPEAVDSAGLDMYILRSLAAVVKKTKRLNTDLVSVADEFGNQLFEELDYEQEARNCARFGELYGDRIDNIVVPAIEPQLTSRRVLTQSWIDGEKGPWAEGSAEMLALGLQCSVLQVLDSGFFHADPHSGNLLRTPDGKLAYLDFGMMANVTAESRLGLVSLALGLQNRDLGLIAENIVRLGFLPDATELDRLVPALEAAFRDASTSPEPTDDAVASRIAAASSAKSTAYSADRENLALKDDTESAFAPSDKAFDGSRLNFTRLNANVQALSQDIDLQFRIPPFYSLIIRTLTILEGLALYVDPNFKLLQGAYPFIVRQILENPESGARDLLKRVMLTPDNRIDWVSLERLVSIARDAKDTSDTASLSRATRRAELAPVLFSQWSDDKSSATEARFGSDAVAALLDFVLSDDGAFLREPLIEECADVLESAWLASLNAASLLTGSLLPRPSKQPDRVALDRVWRLLLSAGEPGDAGSVQNPMELMRGLASLAQLATPVAAPASLLLRQVAGVVIERQAKGLVRRSVSTVVPAAASLAVGAIARVERPLAQLDLQQQQVSQQGKSPLSQLRELVRQLPVPIPKSTDQSSAPHGPL